MGLLDRVFGFLEPKTETPQETVERLRKESEAAELRSLEAESLLKLRKEEAALRKRIREANRKRSRFLSEASALANPSRKMTGYMVVLVAVFFLIMVAVVRCSG